MPLRVKIDNQSSTRKLRDFGVYKARSRNFDIEAQSRNFDISENPTNSWHENEKELVNFSSLKPSVNNSKLPILSESKNGTPENEFSDEDYLITAAEHYSFDRL